MYDSACWSASGEKIRSSNLLGLLTARGRERTVKTDKQPEWGNSRAVARTAREEVRAGRELTGDDYDYDYVSRQHQHLTSES